MDTVIGDWTLTLETDDRGRVVAEVWHTASGKTLAIEEFDDASAGLSWAQAVIKLQGGK